MILSSPDFAPGERLAGRHAAANGNTPPTIIVSDIPEGAVELALIMHDPDAPMPHGFTHWLRYGIRATAGEITLPDSPHRHGVNGFGRRGYGGPMPPIGHGIHHYYFWVYAVGERVSGQPGRLEFLARYGGRILAQERLVGVYSAD